MVYALLMVHFSKISGRRRAIHALALLLALAGLTLRALVPPGFMPEVRASADIPALVICTANGPLTLAEYSGKAGQSERETPPGHSDGGHSDGGQCPFAAFGHAAARPDALSVVAIQATFDAPQAFIRLAPALPADGRPYAPRGPPARA